MLQSIHFIHPQRKDVGIARSRSNPSLPAHHSSRPCRGRSSCRAPSPPPLSRPRRRRRFGRLFGVTSSVKIPRRLDARRRARQGPAACRPIDPSPPTPAACPPSPPVPTPLPTLLGGDGGGETAASLLWQAVDDGSWRIGTGLVAAAPRTSGSRGCRGTWPREPLNSPGAVRRHRPAVPARRRARLRRLRTRYRRRIRPRGPAKQVPRVTAANDEPRRASPAPAADLDRRCRRFRPGYVTPTRKSPRSSPAVDPPPPSSPRVGGDAESAPPSEESPPSTEDLGGGAASPASRSRRRRRRRRRPGSRPES